MNKYLMTIKIRGQLVKTIIFADSEIHARLLVEFKYGMGCIAGSIQRIAQKEALLTSEAAGIKPLKPIQPIKPITTVSNTKKLEKNRITQLKSVKDRATQNLRHEREKQRLST